VLSRYLGGLRPKSSQFVSPDPKTVVHRPLGAPRTS
jgi:hypothetical protein